jgi:hypothetical protein
MTLDIDLRKSVSGSIIFSYLISNSNGSCNGNGKARIFSRDTIKRELSVLKNYYMKSRKKLDVCVSTSKKDLKRKEN